MQSLPSWCEPLLDAALMRAVDRWAIDERSIPSLELMERAGTAVARAVEQLAHDGEVAVVCGKGNNGGDGLVAARLLRDAGRQVTVLALVEAEDLSSDAKANLERLPGAAPVVFTEPTARERVARAAVVVDALLGTGFEGAPHGASASAIEVINGGRGQVLAVDVPSGVDASTGVVAGAAVEADLTVSFHTAKPGLWISPGKRFAGEVLVVDIGIPRGAPATARTGLLEQRVLERLPRRGSKSTKFTNGHVVVVGGSAGMMGAPAMAALAAMRAGAGYVTACVPRTERALLDTQLMEVLSRPLPDREGGLTMDGLPAAWEALERGDALALGPGLGRDPGAGELARELASRAPLAMVLDADGLNAHVGSLASLAERDPPTVLTPHAGELARLLDTSSERVQLERLEHARVLARQAQSIVVLKGDDTLIVEPEGRVAVSRGGAPALATAGTGDVLTGTVAALLAQGLEPFTAAAAAVELHVQAGRKAARRQGSAEGVIASDVIAALPAARGAHEPDDRDVTFSVSAR